MAKTKASKTAGVDPLYLEVTLGKGDVRKLNVRKDISIDTDKLQVELAKQPGKYAFYASLCRLAEKQYDTTDYQLTQLYAELSSSIRASLDKPTETQIKQEVLNHEDYRKLSEKVLDYKYQRDVLKDIVSAFQQRKDRLMSINAQMREERNQY